MSASPSSIGSPSVSLFLNNSESTSHHAQKRGESCVRERSGSLVKVEEVGNKSQEEVLDQNVYVNINAEWVNSKGA